MKTARRASPLYALCAIGAVLVAITIACGSGRGFDDASPTGDGSGADGGGTLGPGFGGGQKAIASIAIDPPTASLTVESGGPAGTQPFKIVATYADGTTGDPGPGATWTASNAQVGTIAGSGVYTTTNSIGGVVDVHAALNGQKADAKLTVKLHVLENTGAVSPAVQAALKGATAKDGAIQWAYPYDGTVFPRGLAGPLLMWNNGQAADAYYVHVASTTFELESFATAAPPSRYAFDATTWQRFVDSTAGAATLDVARYSGTSATAVVHQGWTIAPSSMRGTIYYWANNQGRVMRIKPGATAPDDFSAGTFGSLPSSGCTMTCHTVSADGSTLVSGGDTLGGSYDLLKNQPIFDTGGAPGSVQKRTWSNAALSPNGKYLVQNGTGSVPGPPGQMDGLWNTKDGSRMPSSGLDGAHLGMPSFAPDGSLIAFVSTTDGSLGVYPFDMSKVQAGAPKSLVTQGSGLPISWPTVTPDAKWIAYHRGPLDSRSGNADLFLASAATPGTEIRLARLDGDGYPFAAGIRDVSWNFEPTFAPVPSGGYFWLVFTSRRTYGNLLTGTKDTVKQLWVAAIDLNPAPGADPSHPPFLLPGQDNTSVNMRGFWALDPCKGDGQGCASGTECCGGFCDGAGGDGGLVCKSAGTCANDGDHCDHTSDCCNAPTGTTCINHVCAEPGPQ